MEPSVAEPAAPGAAHPDPEPAHAAKHQEEEARSEDVPEANEDKDDSEMNTWITDMLHRVQPDAEIAPDSVKALTDMLDGITARVLEEATRISHGGAEDAPSSRRQQALTSLDIHQAIKKLLPGEPGDPLRPYLPAVTKQAWHLDKQSLKGIKQKKRKMQENETDAAPPPRTAK